MDRDAAFALNITWLPEQWKTFPNALRIGDDNKFHEPLSPGRKYWIVKQLRHFMPVNLVM